MSNQTFKARDRVMATWRDGYRPARIVRFISDKDYAIEFTDNMFLPDDLLSGRFIRNENQLTPITSYPEYAADLRTYRDAVEAGKAQGQTGQMAALLRLIGHLLGERGGE